MSLLDNVKDLKPRAVKAALCYIPARPLRAVAAAMYYGAIKYEPWNWTAHTEDWREEYGSALMRHAMKFNDPTEGDYDEESGLHHLAHAGACVLIALFHAKEDWKKPNDPPPKLPRTG